MKKALRILIVLILVISCIMSSSVFATDSIQQAESNQENNVVYVENLSSENSTAERQFVKESKNAKSKIIINDTYVNNAIISLEGEATINDSNKIPFNLEGELKRIDTSNDIIVGNLYDKNENFEVVHFSINDSSSKFLSSSGKKYSYTTLNLYLQLKGTRNFIFAEVKLPNELKKEDLFKNISELGLFDAKDLFWYTKILVPAETSSSQQMSLMGAAVQNKTYQDYHTFTYIWIGESYTEYVYVNNILEYPGDSTDYRATAIIKKYYSWTKNNRTGSIISYSTSAEIKNLKIEMSFTNGAYINYLFVGGKHSTGSSYKASIGISFSTPNPISGISFTYQPLRTTTVYPTHINAPSVSVARANGELLLTNEDHMLVRSEYSGTGKVYAKYTYTISTPFASSSAKTMTTQLNADAL